MNKFGWLFIALLLALSDAAVPVSEYCSAYCATCSGMAATNCVTCPTGFNFSSGSCSIDTTVYTSVLETGMATTTFLDQRAWTCGPFTSMPGVYSDNYLVQVANLTTVVPHFSMRARIFVLWIDTWAAANLVQMFVDGTVMASATYSQANGSIDQCKRTLVDLSSTLDTGDFVHSAATVVVGINISSCLDTTKCNWALKELIIIVKACHPYCKICTANVNTACSLCVTPNLLSGTTCSPTCLPGYYNTGLPTCTGCNASCTVCANSPTNCSSCATGYYLLNNTCVNTCPTPYYINGSSCSLCATGCATCTNNPTPCQSCQTGYFLTSSSCVTTCPTGTFGNTATGTCDVCNASCTVCNGTAVNCSACTSTFVLMPTTYTCLSACSPGYYNNSGTCAACNGSCATCTNNPTPCQSCVTTYFLSLSTCVTTCPTGQFGNTATNTCDVCNPSCTVCNGTAVNCSACTSTYVLFSSNYTCLTICPAGYYNSSGTCAACNGSCATCTNNPTPCQSCVTTFYLSLSNCVATCPVGQFGNAVTNTCDACDPSCTTCNNTALNCSACATAYLLFSSNYTCLSSCPAGYYNNSGVCAACNGSCATCTNNPSPCQSCVTTYFLSLSTCVTTCPTGQFGNTATNTCDVCNASCTACNVSSTNCSACTTSYLLFASNYTCLTSCPPGYYNNSGTCAACDSSCATCTNNPSPCQSCNTGWFLSGTTCVTTCPVGTFANSLNNNCDACDSTCTACNGTALNCSACILSYALFPSNFTCLASCPAGWWENTTQNTCFQCILGCATCTGSPTPCQSCSAGYYAYLTGCVNPCPTGFYADTTLGSCQPCNSNCTVCAISSTNCSACIATYYLIVDQNKCVSSCPSTLYYPNVTSLQCLNCATSCQVCAGPATNCSVCTATYYYYASSNLCTLTCPTLTTSTSTWTCIDCDPICLSCSFTATNCTSCISTYVLFQSNYTCITACPTGYFKNSSNICQACQTGCVTCTGIPTPCQSCSTGYFLYSGACGTTCPPGTWANTVTHTCDTCHSNCTTCTSAVTCQTCALGFFWYLPNSTCLNPCPPYYYKNTTDSRCYGYFCSPYCLSYGCSGPAYNQCLNCSGSFYYNSTTNICRPDSSRLILFEGKNDTSVANVTTIGDCGLTYVGMPGLYGPNTNILIYTEPMLMLNHFRVRTRIAFIFIDAWTSGNYLAVNVDGTNNPIAWYQNGQVWQQECGDPTPERSVIVDSGDIAHSNHNITVILKSSGCANPATCLWMYREPIILMIVCNSACLVCNGTGANNCQACTNTTAGNYLLSNQTCALTCHVESFQTGPNMCTFCVWNCTRCNVSTTNCSQCRTGYVYMPDNSSCPLSCPTVGYYEASAVCHACPSVCVTCTSSTVCQTCVTGNYFYNDFCYVNCPAPLINDNYTMTCFTFQNYYVFLTIETYFVQGDILNIDLAFSQPVDFSTFPYQNWQTFNTSSFPTLTMDNYRLTYSIINGSAYRIQITTNDFTFLKNETLSMLTNDTTILYSSVYGRPFYKDNYNSYISQVWSYIKITNMTAPEEYYTSVFTDMSTAFNNATSGQYVQDVKKVGSALLIVNSLQITSCMLLVNTVLPKNFYEGVRLFASLVFFDVPPYQMQSTKPKYFVQPAVSDLTSRRLLAQTVLDQTNFRRTGFTGYFLFDAYPQVIVIALLWLLLIPCYFFRKQKWGGRFYGYFHSALHKFTDLAIMYFTLALLFEFQYFQDQPVRYVSVILCIVANLYLFGYQLYRYYDLAAYRYVEINSPDYERYVQLYGGFLKYLRYVEYKPRKEGAWKFNWREPCSYHIVSYIKKVLMMFALAIFYERAEVQVSILILIQAGEIVRFALVWPFRSRFYNWFRLALEIVLLTLFACMAASIGLLNKIMSMPAEQTGPTVSIFYLVGWIALVMAFAFNIGFLLIFLYDFIHGLRFTNKEIMDRTRIEYYEAKMKNYERGNEEVPERLLKEWAKRGNVDKEKEKKVVKGVKVPVEIYNIRLDEGCYVVDINKVVEFEKRKDFTLINNAQFLKPTRTVEHERNVQPDDELFPYFDRLYREYASDETFDIQVKGFVYVEQSKYKQGEKLELDSGSATQHIITVRNESGDRNVQLDKLEGFPIPVAIFKRLYFM